MASFGTPVLTSAGQVLYAKIQAGTEAHFTRMQLGSGQLGEGQDPATFTALITPAMYVPISSIVANSTLKVAQISALINNSGISTTTYICEIGLFAQDPDLGEILYGYANAGTQGDYFSPISEGAFSWAYQINAAIGNATSVNVTVSEVTNDYTLLNTNTFSILAGDNQNVINKNIDGIFKPYTTTHSGNTYSVTIPDFNFQDGYPLCIRFDAASTGAITLNANNSTAKAVIDYFGNQATNIRAGLIANLRYDAANGNFQLQGEGGDGDATAAQILYGKKATVKTGLVTGTMPNLAGSSLGSGTPTNGTLSSNKFDYDILLPSSGYMDTTTKVHQTLTNLIAANLAKNVTIPELAITGTATPTSLGGRYYASGSASSSSSTQTFTLESGGTSSQLYYVTVTGLTFTPQLIKLKGASGGYVQETFYDVTGDYFYGGPSVKVLGNVQSGGSSMTGVNVKGDVSPCSVTSSGFTLPFYTTNTGVTWEAWGV